MSLMLFEMRNSLKRHTSEAPDTSEHPEIPSDIHIIPVDETFFCSQKLELWRVPITPSTTAKMMNKQTCKTPAPNSIQGMSLNENTFSNP